MSWIKCNHCNTDNDSKNALCTQCGAPLRHDKTFALTLPAVETEYVYGIDVSAWNGTMDWNITKELAIFAFIRAGWGDTGVDTKVDIYRNGIVLTPMIYGLYWYCKPGLNYKTHVATFKRKWLEGGGVLPPVMDLEYSSLPPAATTTWVSNLLQEWAAQTGVAAMIYTSAGWWNANILSSWQCINKLWDANWTTAPVPMIPHGWVDWLFWQYSADGNGLGKKYGSGADGDKDMDLDKFHGNADLFNQLFKVTLPPTPPPPPPAPIDPIVPIKHVIINTGALNMRSLPQANSTDLGTLAMNDDVSVTREANGWYKVEGWISGKLTRGG